MASGDSFRAWFPEMIDELRKFWEPEAKWDDIIDFCIQMTNLRKQIWINQGIKRPIISCNKCSTISESKMPDISPRSLLFMLKKIELITDESLKKLDKDWKKHQKTNSIDAYGNKKE